MQKPRIFGIGNRETYSYIRAEKTFSFMEIFAKQASAVFPTIDVPLYNDIDKNYENTKKPEARNFEDESDISESYLEIDDDGSSIELFYGWNIVFIIIIADFEKRKQLLNKIEQHTQFNLPKKW